MRVTDKQISLEAAKLLGVPFTWGAGVIQAKFVPTDDGPKLLLRDDQRLSGPTKWHEADSYTGSVITSGHVPLHLIAQETTDADRR